MSRDPGPLLEAAILAYRSGRFQESEGLCKSVLASEPENSQATILLGLNAAKQGQIPQAIQNLKRGVDLDPQSFDGLVWLSNLLRGSGSLAEAEVFGRRAVEVKPKDAAGHAALGLCLLASGDSNGAVQSFSKALNLEPRSAPLNHNLGRALYKAGKEVEAAVAFRQAVSLTPNQPESHISLGQLLYETGDRTGATACFRRAYKLEPNTPRGLIQLAKANIEEGEIEDAEKTLIRAIALNPNSAPAHGLLGNVLQQLGRFDAAADELEAAIKLQPEVARPYFDLVYCKTISDLDRPLLERVTAMIDDRRTSEEDLRYLHYALGKAQADLRDFETAMTHLEKANEIMARQCRRPFDRGWLTTSVDSSIEVFTKEFLRPQEPPLPSTQAPSLSAPVFIVGMIRSGTTLVEQIVSSHPDVGAGGELRFWQDKAFEAFPGGDSEPNAASLNELAHEYAELLRNLSPSTRFVTDKMPLNFAHIGLIRRAFPNARFIHCRRNPLDNCLSIYLTPFPSPVDFAHQKDNIVFFYREYLRLMEHWREVLPPDAFIEVDYELLVADRERETRRMIDFLGLEWDDECLRHDQNRRVVRTPSLWQVRQPIYKTSIGRWRDYEPWLGPLKEI
jgi:tetratricopeptide (TPR) repeat protein